MFIDNLALMLINLVAGFFLLAYYMYFGVDEANQRRWAPGFAVVGIIGIATGLHTIFVWPLPASFNIVFGQLGLIFGTLFLVASIAVALRWDLLTIGIYALLGGMAALLAGIRFIIAGLTLTPVLSGTAFILSGLAGIALPFVLWLRANPTIRLIFAILLVIVALIWAFIGYEAFWAHITEFAKWTPLTLRR